MSASGTYRELKEFWEKKLFTGEISVENPSVEFSLSLKYLICS